jgi:hypothetical protein
MAKLLRQCVIFVTPRNNISQKYDVELISGQ